MTSRTPTTKETDTILRDLDSAYSTYTGIIDLLGPYIEADMESQEVGGKLHIYHIMASVRKMRGEIKKPGWIERNILSRMRRQPITVRDLKRKVTEFVQDSTRTSIKAGQIADRLYTDARDARENPFTDPAACYMFREGTVEEVAEEQTTMEPTDSTLSLLSDDSTSTWHTIPST